MEQKYKICSRCIMDNNNDSTIRFYEDGTCSYCRDALERKDMVYFPNKEGELKLNNLIKTLKNWGKGKDYDCMMGISGGLDSSYLAMLGYEWGLRILAIHIDDGFDTEISKSNIEKLCKKCNLDLRIIKPDTTQYNNLTKAFILAESPNLDMPQDNILFSCLHKYAKENNIKYFLSGGNFALESILQLSSQTNAYDIGKIKFINKKFSISPIDKLPLMSNIDRMIDRFVYKFISVRPLNYINYDKEKAIKELKDFCGFEYYESKHCENYLTKIIQLYWLPKKFNYDKRKSHFSSLIVSNQLSREDALKQISTPPYKLENMQADLKLVLDRLNIPYEEFEKNISKRGKLFSDKKHSVLYVVVKSVFNKILIRIKG